MRALSSENIFSAPTASTMSAAPARTCCTARCSAVLALAQAFSTLTTGTLCQAHCAQRELAADHVLAVHVTLRRIREVRGLELRQITARIGERADDGLAREILDARREVLAEGGHAHAGDVDVAAHILPC